MSKKLIAAIILLVLQIIAMLGSALSDAAKAGANGLGAVMGTLGFSAFTIVAIILIAVELQNVHQPKQENTIKQSFKNRNIDDTSEELMPTQATTSDYIPEHELKKVKSTLEHNRTYYFVNSDILRLYQISLIDGELDIPLLKNNVYTFDDEVADKQNEIEQIVQEQVPYFSREYALKHACRYAKAHNATKEDVTKYLDSLYGEM